MLEMRILALFTHSCTCKSDFLSSVEHKERFSWTNIYLYKESKKRTKAIKCQNSQKASYKQSEELMI